MDWEKFAKVDWFEVLTSIGLGAFALISLVRCAME